MFFVKKTLSKSLGAKDKMLKATEGAVDMVESGVFTVAHTASGGKIKAKPKNRRSERRSCVKEEKETLVSCSDFYSKQFILDQMKHVAKTSSIVDLQFEDVFNRRDPDITETVKQVLIAATPSEDKKVVRGSKRGGRMDEIAKWKIAERCWESISFTDCVSDASSYGAFLENKHAFQADMRRRLAMSKKSYALPIRFQTKLEFFSMMHLFDILDMLREVARDDNIVKVEFPGLVEGSPKEIAEAFVSMVDASTMEWTGPSVEIIIKYKGEDMNVVDLRSSKKKRNAATAVLTECAKALEEILHAEDYASDISGAELEELPVVTKERRDSVTDRSMNDVSEELQVRKLKI